MKIVLLAIAMLLSSAILFANEARNSHPTAANPRFQKQQTQELDETNDGRENLDFQHFGTVAVYRKTPHPPRVALFLSGDGGWTKSVVVMARQLTEMNTLVVGIDMKIYLKWLRTTNAKCTWPAADLEALSKYVEKKLDYPEYVLPILIGYSSGATLVYASLAQAPPNTFAGAISLGFCPDLQLRKPMCRGESLKYVYRPHRRGIYLLPDTELKQPWIALQGTVDQVCSVDSAEDYVKQVPNGKIVTLPKVGHGFAVERNWMPQFKEAFLHIEKPKTPVAATHSAAPGPTNVNGLPIVQVPSTNSSSSNDIFAVILSGDGGWASLDRQLGDELAKNGVPVVGFNTLQYFWKKRTPAESAQDLQRVLVHFLQNWKKQKVTIIGYSFGADILPFLINRLPSDLQSRIQLLALLGPSQKATFEFHVSDWLGDFGRDGEPTVPEIKKLKQKSICFYGEKEKDSACPDIQTKLAKVVPLKGGHHFNGDYQMIAKSILQEL